MWVQMQKVRNQNLRLALTEVGSRKYRKLAGNEIQAWQLKTW